jgi:hypothetical protein
VSNGLPYVFTSFVGEGVVTNEAPLWDGGAVPIDRGVLGGPHRDELPLNDQLVAFP